MRVRASLGSPAITASAIPAWACSVSRLGARPALARSDEKRSATSLKTSTNNSRPAFRLMEATRACRSGGSLRGSTGW